MVYFRFYSVFEATACVPDFFPATNSNLLQIQSSNARLISANPHEAAPMRRELQPQFKEVADWDEWGVGGGGWQNDLRSWCHMACRRKNYK
jgi:hypothetical protein